MPPQGYCSARALTFAHTVLARYADKRSMNAMAPCGALSLPSWMK